MLFRRRLSFYGKSTASAVAAGHESSAGLAGLANKLRWRRGQAELPGAAERKRHLAHCRVRRNFRVCGKHFANARQVRVQRVEETGDAVASIRLGTNVSLQHQRNLADVGPVNSAVSVLRKRR